ncbi:perlucin-like protein [Saccostrea cucullata]|uniref:perlucin-like protein n=1 Tax=Saccostrea cuccullata TaxID=36930 RepID=UPI002ED670F7
MDGDLVSVEEGHENTFIRRHLMMFYVHRGAWMGLNKLVCPEKDRWFWGVTSSECRRFDWFSHEPLHNEKGNKYCGLFWQSFNYHWHVDNCAQKNYYICELKPGKKCNCHI